MKPPETQHDHYTTLGARRDATREEIERLYKRLAVRLHPDRGGDEEQMKSLNEAYRVLGNAAEREAYDAQRDSLAHARGDEDDEEPLPRRSAAAQADALGGRVAGALLCLFIGLALVFLVRFQYVVFLWPLALLGAGIVFFGVLMAHGALRFARDGAATAVWRARPSVWAQEAAFWFGVCGGVYGVYLLLRAV
ncbi:MAG TPA: DnaJ domain-containing protein [Pyrinomonadaceae bacterium]|nr:DnaJ domain-containing protein [Pyrinomonadaceae bacterium]